MKFRTNAISNNLSGFLDLVRWISALCVVIEHLRYVWFMEYSSIQQKTLLTKAFYFFTGFGSEAVIVFFVLSGYLVGGGAFKKWQNDSYSAKEYFVSRFSRIYTVLIPALILGGLLDWLGLHYFNQSGIYTMGPSLYGRFLDYIIADNLNWKLFLFNILNVQGLMVSHLGSNGPLWTLAYEWWLYCIFGLVLEVLRRRVKDFMLWILLAALIAVIAICPTKFLIYMGFWILGVLTAVVKFDKVRVSHNIALIIFVILLLISRMVHILFDGYAHVFISLIRDFTLAISFSISIIALQNQEKFLIRYFKFQKSMADFSYTIYLLHVPLLVFIVAVLGGYYGVSFLGEPNPKEIVISIIVLIFTYSSLYGFSLVTERHTSNVKHWIYSKLT
jgi:peptidoglycan/LPS O-acetylase OafA/YrhL